MSARRQDQLDEITAELRADGWWPREKYLCGCEPTALCEDHSRQRAVDHYHPETIVTRRETERACQLPDCGCDGRWHA